MVKIIGVDDKHIKEVSCKKCASRLRYTLSEVKMGSYTDYSGMSEIYDFIECPKCGYKIEV